LGDHVLRKALEARERVGGEIGWPELLQLLEDREFVRFPVQVVFSDEALEPGEFGWPQPLGEKPSAGYRLWLHPRFEGRDADCAVLAAYQLVAVNYGEVATHSEAELFGATLLGLEVEDYYARVCALADELDASA
jgi:hypothetical protein